MQLNWYRLRRAAVAVALLVACSEDPTASLAGDPAGVFFAFDRFEVNVDASAGVEVVVRDASGTALNTPVTVTSTNTQFATVSTAQDPPHVLTRVTVRGANVGTAKIIATAGGLADTMDVATFAASLEVTPLPGDPNPGTLVSGQSKSFTHRYLSAVGRDLSAQVTAPKWSVSASTLAAVDTLTGTITGRAFGSVTVTAKGPGAGEGGITGSATVFVQPAAFQGAITPDPVTPTQVIKITRGTGPAFDSDTRVHLNRAAALDTQRVALDTLPNALSRVRLLTPDSILVIVGDRTSAGNVEVALTGVGASQLSVGTGPLDSLTVQLPGLAGTATPSPINPGNTLIVTAGGGPPFDPTNTRVYLDGSWVGDETHVRNDVIVSQTASAISLEIDDTRATTAPDTIDLLVTRLGTTGGAQAATFIVNRPVTFTGGLSANNGTPAQVITITRPAGAPWTFDLDTRVFFDGIRAFIDTATRTSDVINVAVPVIDKLGQVELRMTRLGTAQEAQSVQFNSTTKNYADPFDAVNNSTSTAPQITANGDYFIVLSGGCLPGDVFGEGTGGADCDDLFRVANPGAAADSVRVELDWSTGADPDIIWCRNVACTSLTTGGGATGNPREVSRVFIPADTTWFLRINQFDWHGAPHTHARVRVSGLGVPP